MLNIIAKNVKSKLSRSVRGKIECHATGATIMCDIINNGDIFRYTQKYTQFEISNGLSSEHIYREIMYFYTQHIKEKFFK